MPRFFFHIHDGESAADKEGTILSDAEVAKQQAITTSGELLREHGIELFNGTPWSMTVVDEAGTTVCTLRFQAETYLGDAAHVPSQTSTPELHGH